MKTLLLADRHGDELEPLTDRIATALLPVAGKPMLVHTIEEIVLSGIADVEVVAGPFSDQIKDLLKGCDFWLTCRQHFLHTKYMLIWKESAHPHCI